MSGGEWQMLLLGFVLGWLVPIWLRSWWDDRWDDEELRLDDRFPDTAHTPARRFPHARFPPKMPTGRAELMFPKSEPPDFSSLFNPNPPCDCERNKR